MARKAREQVLITYARKTAFGRCCCGLVFGCKTAVSRWSSALTGVSSDATTSRHDYEGLPAEDANQIMNGVRSKLRGLAGKTANGLTIAPADFRYHDPVDSSVSSNQGIRIQFEDGSRVVMRLSVTGTVGATLRVYASAEPDSAGIIWMSRLR